MNDSLQLLNERHIEQLIQLSQSVGWDYDRFEIGTILSGTYMKVGKLLQVQLLFLMQVNLLL